MNSEELNGRLPYAFGNELDYLRNLATELPNNAKVVMLGVGPAVMMLALYEGNPRLQFYGVDNRDLTGKSHLAAAGCSAAILNMDSAESAKLFPDRSVDLLIIDADHTYEGVVRDIVAWRNKVKGILFFHDYVPHANDAPNNGVARAIADYRKPAWTEIARPGISIVFRIGK